MISKKYVSIFIIAILTILLNACTGAGESSNNTVNTDEDVIAPTKPENLRTSTLLPTSIDISWDASSDNMALAGYHVYKNNVLVTSTSTTEFSDNQVTANSTYEYAVVAYDASGNNTMSDTLSVSVPLVADLTPPTAPGNLRTTAISSNSISLAWNISTDNIAVTGYRVYRGNTLLTTTSSLAYVSTGLSVNTVYQYHVDAIDAAGNTASSNTLSASTVSDTTAPTAPGNFRTTAVTNTSISLAWNASTDNVGVTGYRVYRGTTLITTTTSLTYTHSGLTAGTTYQLRVDAFDSANNSASSSTLNAATTGTAADTLAPTVPGNLRSTAVSSNSLSLAWNASTDNVAVTSYRIYRNGTQISTTANTTYTDSTVAAGTTYSYTVSAYDAAGNNTTSVALQVAIPTAATANASLSWTPPTQNTDNSALTNLSGYIVRYGLSQNNLNNTRSVSSGLTSIVIENLQSGVTYYFSITAINSLGVESDLSNIVSKTTS